MAETAEKILREIAQLDAPAGKPAVAIVDDEDVVRYILTSMLEDEEVDLVTYETANDALEDLEKVRPQVVITDKNLPEITGIDLIRLGKRILPETEFLIVTGYASLESAIQAMELGAFGYLTKPLSDVEQVKARVMAALAKNRAVVQNRLLVERLKTAYEDLYKTKVEIEMLNNVSQMRLEQREAQIKERVEGLLEPMAALKEEMGALVGSLEKIGNASAERTHAMKATEQLEVLLGQTHELSRSLSEQMEE